MNPITIEVSGTPKGQPRARAFARNFGGGKWQARLYDPGTAEGWKACIALAAKPFLVATPLTGPLRVDVTFRFPRPKSHYRTGRRSAELRPDAPVWHTSKPDRDNLDKAVLDALTQLGMWADDAQVCAGHVAKGWDRSGGATITITGMSGGESVASNGVVGGKVER